MRPDQGNLLDLNKLPEDHYGSDGKQVVDDSSSVAGSSIKMKNSAKDGKDESGKVYECRYCSATFRKYQALGGHMKRHGPERATEKLNWARQLVSNHDNLPVAPHHLSLSNFEGSKVKDYGVCIMDGHGHGHYWKK